VTDAVTVVVVLSGAMIVTMVVVVAAPRDPGLGTRFLEAFKLEAIVIVLRRL